MTKLRIPKIIGHRGAAAYAPENTLASLHAAADTGAEWVEIDAQLTRDGIPVVFHDEDLARCTGAAGLVCETDWKTLRELDAGSWFGDSFIGERIPSLEEALNVILERKMGVNLEIKPSPGTEVETAEAVLDVATRIWPDDLPPPLVSSFQHVSLETAMDMIPEWPRGLLLETEPAPNWAEIMEYLQAATLNFDGRTATYAQVAAFLAANLPVLAYTINDPVRARELLEWGVTAIFTDNPDLLLEAVETIH